MPEKRPACLVTGCAGFVGGHLTQRLLELGFPVLGVDNFFSGRRSNMAAFVDRPEFSFYERSITEPDLLVELKARRPDLETVFHLAAVVSVPYSVEHPEETMAVNRDASLDLHRQALDCGLSAFVFAGSAAEYGDDPRLPLAEAYAGPETKRQSPYGQAKYEVSTAVAASGFGCALRFFNIYGPRQDPSSPYSGVISRFIDQGLRSRPATVFGDGGQTRDFIHAADAVAAYLLAAGFAGGPALSGIFNAASGESVSILELARLVARLTGGPKEPVFLPPRRGDIRHSLADVGVMRRRGFAAKISLPQGLAETVAWCAENNAS